MENTLADTFWVLWIAYKSTKWQHLTTRWPFNSRKTKTSRKVCWTSSFLRSRSQAPRVVPEWERFAPKCNRRLWWRMTFSDEKQSNREILSTISRQLSSWVELGKDEGTYLSTLLAHHRYGGLGKPQIAAPLRKDTRRREERRPAIIRWNMQLTVINILVMAEVVSVFGDGQGSLFQERVCLHTECCGV